MPNTEDTVTWAPDDGWRYHPKHVEQFAEINKLYIVESCWIIIDTYYAMHGPLNVKIAGILNEDRYKFFYHISLNPSWCENVFLDVSFRENLNIRFISTWYFFPAKSCLFLDNMGKNIVEPNRPQITIWRVVIACCKLSLQTHTQNMSYSKLFHGKDFTRTRVNIMFIPTLPLLFCVIFALVC